MQVKTVETLRLHTKSKGPFQIQIYTSLCTADESQRFIQHDRHSSVNISGTLLDDRWRHEKLWLKLKSVRKCRQTSFLFPSNALMPVPHIKHRCSITAPMWTTIVKVSSWCLEGCGFKSQDCLRATVEHLLSAYKSFLDMSKCISFRFARLVVLLHSLSWALY